MKRIELESGKAQVENLLSELPEQTEFKVDPISKIGFMLMVNGIGLAYGLYSILNGKILFGVLIILGFSSLYLLLHFISHKPRDKKYIISKHGIKIDNDFYEWTNIIDLHLTSKQLRRGSYIKIRFYYKGKSKEFTLDSMTKSTEEIRQTLYLYQSWWKKNTTNSG